MLQRYAGPSATPGEVASEAPGDTAPTTAAPASDGEDETPALLGAARARGRTPTDAYVDDRLVKLKPSDRLQRRLG